VLRNCFGAHTRESSPDGRTIPVPAVGGCQTAANQSRTALCALTGKDGKRPNWLIWDGRGTRVCELLNFWRETGYWWEGEHEKDFYRVQCDRRQYDIYRDRVTGEWFLYRIHE